ncbi:hypothetical protein AAVH_14338, partial [Aphelenchoides avenae]
MASPPVAALDETDQKQKKTVKKRRVDISVPARFVPKKRTRSTEKLEKLMRETTERTETVTLDSESDAESCDSDSTTATPAAQPANRAPSASESRAVTEQPSEPLSAGATAIFVQCTEEQHSAEASPAAVHKEQQPCSSSSLGLRIGAASAGRPLAEKSASTGISKKNKASCLPAEVLLNILHCLDFNTLVAVYVTNHLFHIVVKTNAGVLAKRREMRLYIQDDGVILYDCDTRHEILCIPAISSASTVNAMRDVASHIGFHNLKSLDVTKDWRNMPMEPLFTAAPALRFVKTLRLSIAAPDNASAKSPDDVNRFAAQFPRLRRLCFPLAFGPAYFDWCSFLRSEGALKLPELDAREMCCYAREDRSMEHPTEEEWLRYATDCTQLPGGSGKFFRLNLTVSRSFLLAS